MKYFQISLCFCIVFLVSCEKKSVPNQSSDSSSQISQETSSDLKVLKVKGFYINMKLEDALDNLLRITKELPENLQKLRTITGEAMMSTRGSEDDPITERERSGSREFKLIPETTDLNFKELVLNSSGNLFTTESFDKRFAPILVSVDSFCIGGITLYLYDDTKNVCRIEILGETSNLLFNTNTYNVDEFTQSFINAYHIPKMDAIEISTTTHKYQYTDWQNGWEIIIFPDNSIMIEYVVKRTETKFD